MSSVLAARLGGTVRISMNKTVSMMNALLLPHVSNPIFSVMGFGIEVSGGCLYQEDSTLMSEVCSLTKVSRDLGSQFT